jgi:hypothetical protein
VDFRARRTPLEGSVYLLASYHMLIVKLIICLLNGRYAPLLEAGELHFHRLLHKSFTSGMVPLLGPEVFGEDMVCKSSCSTLMSW